MGSSTDLFVYGTLRHDQVEHARFCRGVSGWLPARVRGRLFRLREGYLILVVRPEVMLLEASADAEADEVRRAALPRVRSSSFSRGDRAAGGDPWVEGECLVFADAARAWPPLDAWECFEPGAGGVYRRCVVSGEVRREDGEWETRLFWAYVSSAVPAGASAIESPRGGSCPAPGGSTGR